MKYSKLLINALLFFTIPSIVAYPQSEIPTVNIHSKEISHEADVKERIFQNDQLFSYDDVLSLLQDLEEGKLEKRYSAEELEKLNHFLSFLAKQGVLPNEVKEQYILQNDIEDLLYSNQNSYEYAYFPHQGEEYVIASSVFSSQGEIVFCKSWIQKQWSQTKKFVKKHKKAIIIGTAVVVAAATVVCVVAVASAASAVAVAAAGPNREKIDKPQEQDNQGPGAPFSLPVMIVENEAPILNAVIDEYVSTFKEGIVEENFLRSSTNLKDYGDDYFCENIRNLGAKLAHETLDGVSELISCVPLLLDEIKSIGVRIVPDFSLLNDGIEIIPMEKYEKLVAIGHEEIDHIFVFYCMGVYPMEFVNKSGSKILIEKCEQKDLESCYKMAFHAVSQAYSHLTPQDLGVEDMTALLKQVATEIDENFQGGFEQFMVAKKEGEVVGLIGFKATETPHQIYIARLVVDQLFTREGIGKALVFSAFDIYENVEELVVITRKINESARQFYKRLGFKASSYMHGGYSPEKYTGYEWKKGA